MYDYLYGACGMQAYVAWVYMRVYVNTFKFQPLYC